jgi:rod shape determining protein RodA
MSAKGRLDRTLLIFTLLVVILGVFFIYSATWDKDEAGQFIHPIVVKQSIWALTGFLVLIAIANIDYLTIVNFAYFIYILNIIALVFLLLFGGERYGARRWITLGPLSLQPSEFMKITVILALSEFLGNRRDRTGSVGNFVGAILLVMPAALLIFLQPDLGTAIVLVPILFSILFVCGERIKYILVTIIAALSVLPFGWSLLKDYQKSRLMVFLNPNLDPLGAGYTIIQSKIAIGSGGFFGKGWLNGTQSYLKFLPERHTDFIFSVIGEEWGFIGAVLLIFLYIVIFARGIRIITRTKEIEGRVIATGIVTLLSFHLFVNISMTIGLMPVVGLPLPAISYGGSNTIAALMCIGLLLSVSRKNT